MMDDEDDEVDDGCCSAENGVDQRERLGDTMNEVLECYTLMDTCSALR